MSLQLYIAFFPTGIPAAVYCRLKDSLTLWTPAGAFAALVSATRLNLSVVTPIMRILVSSFPCHGTSMLQGLLR